MCGNIGGYFEIAAGTGKIFRRRASEYLHHRVCYVPVGENTLSASSG
jgi:hypothetical protein